MPGQGDLTLRQAQSDDLDVINAIIERALMNWDLPERVKRLSLSSHLYREHDLQHMTLLLALQASTPVGVAACEAMPAEQVPAGRPALLLHGIYVEPGLQRRGIGRYLLNAVEHIAAKDKFSGILVRAQAGAEAFFSACGMERLPIDDASRDYPHRFWKAVL